MWTIKATPPDPAVGADVYLIDGNNHARRAFHAHDERMSFEDQPTNAIYGFADFLHRLRREYKMTKGVVCWDLPGGTFRHRMYEGYKERRSTMPEMLAAQWPALHEVASAFNLTNAALEQYEADDLIGTLARAAAARGEKVCIVTSDKDSWQLIDENIVVLRSLGRGEMETMTMDKVHERLGVSPLQIPDMVGLKGDKSDDIPGVELIGEKTAAELIRQFGSLEAVLLRVDEVSGKKRQQNLREQEAMARLSKQLATIDCEVPIDCNLIGEGVLDVDTLRGCYERYGLQSLIRRMHEIIPTLEAPAAKKTTSTAASASREPAEDWRLF